VLTLARPSPDVLATSPAVIALPLASAASTALLVAPRAVRGGPFLGPVEDVATGDCTGSGEAGAVVDFAPLPGRAGFWIAIAAAGAERVRRRERVGDELAVAAAVGVAVLCEPSAASAWRSFCASESSSSSRA
jgi:hypothetical protein